MAILRFVQTVHVCIMQLLIELTCRLLLSVFAYSQNHVKPPPSPLMIENVLSSPVIVKTCIFNQLLKQKSINCINKVLQNKNCTDMCNTVRYYSYY